MALIFFLVMLFLPILAQLYVKGTFSKYSKVYSSRGLTAEQVARMILDSNNLHHVRIEHVRGSLTDHYSPKEEVVRLSETVYGKTSVAAIGVAAHECGHACQHAEEYTPVVIRAAIVPAVNICSFLWYYVLLIGIVLFSSFPYLVYIGIGMYAAVVVFQAVTLPTELNASKRALRTLEEQCILESDELPKARKVLFAAAMTYITALITSLMQLLRLISCVKRK